MRIEKLPTQLVELRVASPVKFTHVVEKNELKKLLNIFLEGKYIKYYKLEKICQYNIENNILIKIPDNLSKIV